ncbi:glycosyltransferase family 4 protein [soil metagenome]
MPARGRSLPYRIDLLEDHGLSLRWIEDGPGGKLRSALRRIERVGAPVAQAWQSTAQRKGAFAVLAMFESEAHGLALARTLVPGRRRAPLVVIACWLADLVVASPARRRAYRVLYRQVDAIVVFSENQRATLSTLLGYPAERIHVIRFGVDLDELRGRPTTDGTAVVAIGRDLGRDWHTLAEAATGTGWDVELVTRPQQVADVDLPSEVRLSSPLDRAAYLDLLAGSGVVVIPTEVREYPTGQTVLLEAMALGKACVVTSTPAMREYVEDGVTALLVEPHDPAALQSAVEELRSDPALRARLGRQAAVSEQAKGGAAAMWAQVAQVLEQLR